MLVWGPAPFALTGKGLVASAYSTRTNVTFSYAPFRRSPIQVSCPVRMHRLRTSMVTPRIHGNVPPRFRIQSAVYRIHVCHQRTVVEGLVGGTDVFGILPTGYGNGAGRYHGYGALSQYSYASDALRMGTRLDMGHTRNARTKKSIGTGTVCWERPDPFTVNAERGGDASTSHWPGQLKILHRSRSF